MARKWIMWYSLHIFNSANHRKFTVQHVGWRQHRLGGCSYKNPCLTYSNGILCSRCFAAEAHLTPVLLCFFTALDFFEGLIFYRIHQWRKKLKKVWPSAHRHKGQPFMMSLRLMKRPWARFLFSPTCPTNYSLQNINTFFFFLMKIWSYFFFSKLFNDKAKCVDEMASFCAYLAAVIFWLAQTCSVNSILCRDEMSNVCTVVTSHWLRLSNLCFK